MDSKDRELSICITDPDNKTQVEEESFLNDQYRVISRSGLNVTEIQVIEILKKISIPGRILFLENRTGVCSIIARSLYPEAEITIYCLDLYYANKIRRNLSKNGVSSVTVWCKPYIGQKDVFDVIFFQLSRGSATKELVLDLIQQVH